MLSPFYLLPLSKRSPGGLLGPIVGVSGQGPFTVTPMVVGGARAWTWPIRGRHLVFRGFASDRTREGKVRQIGQGWLHVYDGQGGLMGSFRAISGSGINGLLPNGLYEVTGFVKGGDFADEAGLSYKLPIRPVGAWARGFGRTALLIHPTMYYWARTLNGVQEFEMLETDGCIGLLGNAHAGPFRKLVSTFFANARPDAMRLEVAIAGNAQVLRQLGDRAHYLDP